MAKTQTVALELSEQMIGQLRSEALPGRAYGVTPAEIVTAALEDYLKRRRELSIPQETLREISGRAGLKPIINSPQGLVKAFEVATGLDRNSVIIHLDEWVAVQLKLLGENTGMTLAECVAQLYHKALALGWIMSMDEKRYVFFGREEWARLQFETCKKQPSGSELIQEIMKRPKPVKVVEVLVKDEEPQVGPSTSTTQKGVSLAELVSARALNFSR